MAVLSVNYNEGGDLKYIEASIYHNGESIDYNSGDFVKDWYDLMKFILCGGLENYYHIVFSSSVHHFVDDTGLYDTLYLRPIDPKSTKWEFTDQYDENAFQFFVPKGKRYTWEQYKQLHEYGTN